MKRRTAIGTLAASSFFATSRTGKSQTMQTSKRQYYELRLIQMRNGTQTPQRSNDFLGRHFLPAATRAGIGPVGVFNPIFGEGSPYTLLLLTYPSFADVEVMSGKLLADPDLTSAMNEFHKPMDPGYVRYESTLLRAFGGHPQLTPPPELKAGHIFELRTYESNSELTLRKKVEMFNGGEMQIFQRLGMNPVFFGEALIGPKLPHLTYMLAYEDLAARDRVWKAFGSDAEWQKLRSKSGLSDAEIVSNISNSILRGAPYSMIR